MCLGNLDSCCANRANEKQLSPRKPTLTEVWTKFNNGGGWPTQALSVMVGLIGSVFANNGKQNPSPKKTWQRSTIDADFKGTDCAVHVSFLF